MVKMTARSGSQTYFLHTLPFYTILTLPYKIGGTHYEFHNL